MRIIKHSGTDSWLQVPVKLKRIKDKDLHVTIKYFGTAKINPHEVDLAVYLHSDFEGNSDILWKCRQFNKVTKVLELYKNPNTEYVTTLYTFGAVRRYFDLIKDDYKKFRPHITVPNEYWDLVKKKKLTPQNENLTFGGYQLYLGTGL